MLTHGHIVCMDTSTYAAGALAGSKLWGGEEGLTVHTTSQHGSAALQCMSFQPQWSTALDRCKQQLKFRSLVID